jgi:hypothetical protein
VLHADFLRSLVHQLDERRLRSGDVDGERHRRRRSPTGSSAHRACRPASTPHARTDRPASRRSAPPRVSPSPCPRGEAFRARCCRAL